ncbi:ABC transporter permease [Dyella dinghuensis]|uniref:Transport permease protein n=1 Tax=Dyella dinghuensis TaxID=1920169 RepID=A0A432LYR4_9GAMM|nr:ABC transporter permease [Dyella dinghuensis]RUL66829.1 ABC transporter permease [Dyella dinghuensis]
MHKQHGDAQVIDKSATPPQSPDIAPNVPQRARVTTTYKHALSPSSLCLSMWVHRALIFQLTRKEVIGRYKGSLLGLAWSFVQPLCLLGIYTVFFTEVFHVRWAAINGKGAYATALFAGLIVYTVLAECITRGTQLIVGNASYVTKVVFPLEILPWVSSFTAIYHATISVMVLMVFVCWFNGKLPITFVLFPLVLMPLLLLSTAVGWLTASIGVYVRDLGQTTSLIVIALLYTSPVFSPFSQASTGMRTVMQLNPLTFLIEQARAVLLWGQWPSWSGLLIYSAMSAFACWLTYVLFQRTRGGFIDVL